MPSFGYVHTYHVFELRILITRGGVTDLKEEITLDIRLTWYSHVHAGTINLKETLFLTGDKEDTVHYKWLVSEDKWS